MSFKINVGILLLIVTVVLGRLSSTDAQAYNGIPPLPNCYYGVNFLSDPSALGALSPAISVVHGVVPDLVSIVTDIVSTAVALLIPDGIYLTLNIGNPVGCTGLTASLTNPLSGILATATYSVPLDLTLDLLGGGAIFCTSAPGCDVHLTAILLNDIAVTADVIVSGGDVGAVVNGVIFNNGLFATCGWFLSATLRIKCATDLFALPLGPSGCNFLWATSCNSPLLAGK